MEDNKKCTTIWLRPSVIRRMDTWMEEANCRSRSEFIEKAVRFYMGYLGTEDTSEYLSDALVATLRGIIADSTNRTNGILFKCAVEQGIMAHTIAAQGCIRLYVPQGPVQSCGKLLAGDQDDCERYEPLPQHRQAGAGRSGAARLSRQSAPVSTQWKQYLQSLYAQIIPKSLVSKYDTKLFIWAKCKTIVPSRGNYTCLLNRGGVQYEPTGTAHSIGD